VATLKLRLSIALVGAALFWAAAAFAAREEPKRPFAHLDPPDFRPPHFQGGELLGWYSVFYVGERRVVCANPVVWDGPKVITCDNVVAVDFEKRPGTAAEDPGEPVAGGRQ
jgi:hypothetical protein